MDDRDTQRLISALQAMDDLTATIKTPEDTAPGGTTPITEARAKIGQIARAVGVQHERHALTDRSQCVAVLVHPDDWADLVDALAIARHAMEQAAGIAAPPIPHEDAMAQLDEAARKAQNAA